MNQIATIKTDTEEIPIYDEIILEIIKEFAKRSEVGIKKYGTTLHENNTDNFYRHAYEELLDFVGYVRKIGKNI